MNRTGKSRLLWNTNIHESNQHLCSATKGKSQARSGPWFICWHKGKDQKFTAENRKILWSFPLIYHMALDIWTCTVYSHVLALVKKLQCRRQFNWDLQICMKIQLMCFVIRSTWTLQWLFIFFSKHSRKYCMLTAYSQLYTVCWQMLKIYHVR